MNLKLTKYSNICDLKLTEAWKITEQKIGSVCLTTKTIICSLVVFLVFLFYHTYTYTVKIVHHQPIFWGFTSKMNSS